MQDLYLGPVTLVFASATKGSGRGAQISPQSDWFGKKFGFCSGDTAKSFLYVRVRAPD